MFLFSDDWKLESTQLRGIKERETEICVLRFKILSDPPKRTVRILSHAFFLLLLQLSFTNIFVWTSYVFDLKKGSCLIFFFFSLFNPFFFWGFFLFYHFFCLGFKIFCFVFVLFVLHVALWISHAFCGFIV